MEHLASKKVKKTKVAPKVLKIKDPDMDVKLSALVVAHNEERMIEKALESLLFCDEIVVCLDRCTDATKEIAAKYASKIIEGTEADGWQIEGVRRNAGIKACSFDWILEIDADERVSVELAKEIKEALPHAPAGYFMLPIDNYVGDRLVNYGWAGSFGTTSVARLFKKGCKIWGNQMVHPDVQLTGFRMRFDNPVVHLVDDDINDMIDRLKRYTDKRAQDMVMSNSIPSFKTTLRKALTRFYKSYLVRKGYKEGLMGFLLASMAALFMILSHIKAVEELGGKPGGNK